MAGLCFYLDREFDLTAWREAASAAGDIDTFAIINRTADSLDNLDTVRGLCVYANLNQFLDDHRGRAMSFMCAASAPARTHIPLWRFDHDTDWYVFGPAAGWDHEINIGVFVPQADPAALPSAQVAAAVMLHRHWVIHAAAG